MPVTPPTKTTGRSTFSINSFWISFQKNTPGAGSESDLRLGYALQSDLAGANRVCLTLQYALQLLAAATHTCNLYYSLPVVRHAYSNVCYLEHHTQAQLSHTLGISVDEVYYFLLGFITKIIVI